MADTLQSTLSAAVIRLLRPLIRVVLRNGVSYQAFSELVKWVFVDVARSDFGIPGRKVTKSRIAVITGLTRREVDRVVNMEEPREEAIAARRNRAARVLSGWAEDRDFRTASGPRDIPIDGDGLTFSELVRRYSGNQPTRAVLDELERVGQGNPNLFIGSTDDQITHEELKIREGQFDVHLAKVEDLRSAQRALDSILDGGQNFFC
jgi:hypothetical protein